MDNPTLKIVHGIRRTLQDCSDSFNRLNFEPISMPDQRNREQPAFNLTRDGFAIVAMGFTGREALKWKIAFLYTARKTMTITGALTQDSF